MFFKFSYIFQNFDVYFINQYLNIWGIAIVFLQVPLFKNMLEFSINLLIPA